MISAGSSELTQKWVDVLHNDNDDYIIPESDVNVVCPYNCISTSGYTVNSYYAESISTPNILARDPATINCDKKIATFEWNFWVLDGSFTVLDDNETYNGYMSSNMSDENCEYQVRPWVFFDNTNGFNLRKNQTIKFAPAYSEVPAYIEIFGARESVVHSYYFNIEEMLETENFTTQEYVNLYASGINEQNTYTRVGISFQKSLMPYRRARLTEYNNGYKFFKNKYDLHTFTHSRSVALAMDELPQNDLECAFVDLIGIFDANKTNSPFHISFNNGNKFYIYYGYNFDDIGWNYVLIDNLCYMGLEINRDSLETTLKLQSTLQLCNAHYNADDLDTVIYSGGSYTHTKTGVWAWNTFKGFLTAIKTILDIPDFQYSSNDITFLNTIEMEWQNYMTSTTVVGAEDNFTKIPLKEIVQQICALLRCALVRQNNGVLKIIDLYPNSISAVDTIEPVNILSYPTKTDGEQYKYITITTPHTYEGQSDDKNTEYTDEEEGSGQHIKLFPAKKKFTVPVAVGTEEITLSQNIVPLNYRDYRSGCWTWNSTIWQEYAYHFWRVKRATRFEFGEVMLNPLIQVADVVGASIGDDYTQYLGRVEKIEINYDGSFKGAITLCSFLNS